jgi:hypothetical protein
VQSETIFVYLLDEGVECWRPVQAHRHGDDQFEVLGEMPRDELWQFLPGSRVRCRPRQFADGSTGLVAYETVSL